MDAHFFISIIILIVAAYWAWSGYRLYKFSRRNRQVAATTNPIRHAPALEYSDTWATTSEPLGYADAWGEIPDSVHGNYPFDGSMSMTRLLNELSDDMDEE